MLRELFAKTTTNHIDYVFEHRLHIHPCQPIGLREFIAWLTESDVYVYLDNKSEHPDYFTGAMTAFSLLGCVAIELNCLERFEEFIDSISWEYAHQQVYGGEGAEGFYEYLSVSEEEWSEALRPLITSAELFFQSGFYDVMQICYAFDLYREEIIDEPELWPDLIE